MNQVVLMGRLTKDPQMKYTPQGTSVTSFSIAVNRRFAKEGQQAVDFISCVAWRKTAELIFHYFKKGNMIAIVGSIQTRSWEGQDGKRQYATEVLADEVYFTGSKAESGTTAGSPSMGGYQPSPQAHPQSAENTAPIFDDFDTLGFTKMDGSEEDLPF